MHYISATRRKSCAACVKSKRRCDLEYPFCRRCLVKGLDCSYPTSPPRDRIAAVVGRTPAVQSSPDLSPRTASAGVVDSAADYLPFNGANTDPLGNDRLPFSYSSSGDSSSSSPDSWQDELAVSAPVLQDRVPFEEPQLGRTLWPQVTVPNYLNDAQVQYVTRALRSFVSSMAYTGSTPFLHQHLWKRYQPDSYQDCVALSALYLCKTSANSSLITSSIDTKMARLKASSASWSLMEHLAAVQTLIIYQIIRLFDPSLNEQAQAQKHNRLLETWAALLWKRSFNEPTMLANCYETWVFNESLRRTVMISVFVRCATSIVFRDGLADQVPVLARIPFTKDLQAWATDPEEWNSIVLPELLEEDGLTAYGDFADKWTHQDELETLDPFGKLLLAACRGADDPRLLS
ncbi:hypothetical protein SVAN01_04134 [Stagonosporopsis vannaccii]|nr:hypothetical protein SVAN01_04134 [Stagonosporopsis vannaccii]